MNPARLLVAAVTTFTLSSVLVVGGVLDPIAATATVAVALLATISSDAATPST
jgi:hypothetical protein